MPLVNVELELVEENTTRILAGLGEHLKDPKVISAVLLSMVVYDRANDVQSLMNKFSNYIRKMQGLDALDIGLSNFQKAVALLVGGLSGYGLAVGVDRLATELEIKRLKDKYQAELKEYNLQRPAWEVKDTIAEPIEPEMLTLVEWMSTYAVANPAPEPPTPLLSFEQWAGGPLPQDPATLALLKVRYLEYTKQRIPQMLVEQKLYDRTYTRWQELATKAWNEYNAEVDKECAHYRKLHNRWLEIQSMPEPIHPVLDPAVILWEGGGEQPALGTVSQKDAATYALIAFIIGLNPTLVPEALKGVGEIVKGIGEIVPG